MKTFALFSDGTYGTASQIITGFFDPEENIPIKLIPIGITDRQVIHSAENGIWSAYRVLNEISYLKQGDKFSLTYQFETDGTLFYTYGESAGLGFCLKFAQQIHFIKVTKDLGYSIAATGIISDGTKMATVNKVEGIKDKLGAALSCLNKGDRFFYPHENEKEIGERVKEEAAKNEIELIPVSTVKEAIIKLLQRLPKGVYPIEIRGLSEYD